MRRFIAANQSLLIALAIAAGLTVWLLSGGGADGASRQARPAPAARSAAKPFAVRVATVEARPVSRDVVIYGRTEPARTVTLRAEVDGRVVEIGAERGARVAQGDLVARVDLRDLEARLREAVANVREREIRYQAAQRLEKQQFQSQTALAEAEANLAAARARVERVRIDIANTTIRAPFDGILEARPVEIGDYLSEGDQVARIIDVDPLVVAGNVTQRELGHIRVGADGSAALLTGERVAGRVRYVSSESDQATRTFRVELEVVNPEAALVAGVTAEISIPTPSTRAHLVSPALLALDDRERIGVKTVSDEGVVEFRAVEILKSDPAGVWVTGLPERARVITVGQGFVRAGERVTPVADRDGDATTLGAASGHAAIPRG